MVGIITYKCLDLVQLVLKNKVHGFIFKFLLGFFHEHFGSPFLFLDVWSPNVTSAGSTGPTLYYGVCLPLWPMKGIGPGMWIRLCLQQMTVGEIFYFQ